MTATADVYIVVDMNSATQTAAAATRLHGENLKRQAAYFRHTCRHCQAAQPCATGNRLWRRYAESIPTSSVTP